MGLKAVDLVPISATGPTALIPVAKDVHAKAFQVTRTDTTASLKCVLPADSTIMDFLILGVASNAGTTANISIGSTATATEYVNAQDVKTAGGVIRPTSTVSATNLPNLEPVPLTGQDITIYAKYAETGGASSAGGPYTVYVTYLR